MRSTARPQPESISPPSDDAETGRAIFLNILTPNQCIFITAPTISSDTPTDEQQIARNVQALKSRLRGRGGRRGGRGGGRVETGSGRESNAESE